MHKGFELWGYSLLALLQSLKQAGLDIPREVERCAKSLDLYYIPTRYPNGLPAGKPSDYYTEEEAREAIDACNNILQWCKAHIHKEG